MTSYKKTLVFLLINIMLVSPVAMSHSLHLSRFVTSTVVNAHGGPTPCEVQKARINNLGALIEDLLGELEDLADQIDDICGSGSSIICSD